MPHFLVPISPNGALVNLLVGVSAPRAQALAGAGQPVPAPVLVVGLIDTGASGLAIDPTILQGLGLQQTGTTPLITPSTGANPVDAPVYDVSVKIPQLPPASLDFDSVPAIQAVLLNQGFGALVGRDILNKCLIIYDGVAGYCSVAF